jgi:hypothetical protein
VIALKKLFAFALLALLAGTLYADAPPSFPCTFYGRVNSSASSLNGLVLTATINGSSANYTVGNTTTYSCSPDTCNYYVTVSRPSGDTSSTSVAFTVNSKSMGTGNFSAGGATRLDFFNASCFLNLCSDGSCQATCGGGGSGGGSSGGSNSGGGSVGGGGGAATTKETATYDLEVGSGYDCQVNVTREMQSGNVTSVLTTTLRNIGGASCNLEDFVFTDTIPSEFAGINEITFNPQYSSQVGWTVTFGFPTFLGGESKTITYSVDGWVGASRAKNFTLYSMSAKKKEAAAPTTPTQPTGQQEQPSQWIPTKLPDIFGPQEPEAPSAPAEQQKKQDNTSALLLTALLVLVVLGAIGGVAIYMKRKKKG